MNNKTKKNFPSNSSFVCTFPVSYLKDSFVASDFFSFEEFLFVYPDFLGYVCIVYKFNRLFQLYLYLPPLPPSEQSQQLSWIIWRSFIHLLGSLQVSMAHAILVGINCWKDCFIFLPVRRNKGASYMLIQEWLTRQNSKGHSLPVTQTALNEAVGAQGKLHSGRCKCGGMVSHVFYLTAPRCNKFSELLIACSWVFLMY